MTTSETKNGTGLPPGETRQFTNVTAYGAPSPYDMYPLPAPPPDLFRPNPLSPPVLRNIFSPTAEQIASAVMQRVEPALAEIHARLDAIERRLPVTSEDRAELEKARAATKNIQEGLRKLLADDGDPAEKAAKAARTTKPLPKKKR